MLRCIVNDNFSSKSDIYRDVKFNVGSESANQLCGRIQSGYKQVTKPVKWCVFTENNKFSKNWFFHTQIVTTWWLQKNFVMIGIILFEKVQPHLLK